jgi:hypothetical protein
MAYTQSALEAHADIGSALNTGNRIKIHRTALEKCQQMLSSQPTCR